MNLKRNVNDCSLLVHHNLSGVVAYVVSLEVDDGRNEIITNDDLTNRLPIRGLFA